MQICIIEQLFVYLQIIIIYFCKYIMDIVSRIKYFLDVNNIANSQFADKCDIPRPTVSQLLNGRNKKISNEVISKIHAAYPNLSIMWLMFGEKPMLLHSHEANGNEPETSSTLFESSYSEPNEQPNRIVFDDGLSETETNEIEYDDDTDGVNDIDDNTNGCNPQTLEAIVENVGKAQKQKAQGTTKKHIVNVMVFYSDNSFESFIPST